MYKVIIEDRHKIYDYEFQNIINALAAIKVMIEDGSIKDIDYIHIDKEVEP